MEWNNHPFEKDTPVRTFGNRSELAAWDAENCDRCIKHDECELCDAITAAYIGDGRVPLWVAKRIGCLMTRSICPPGSKARAGSAGRRRNEIFHFNHKNHDMKSEKAKEFIDKNEMAAANLVDKDGCGWAVVGIYDAYKAVELAEKDARERMKRAFCLQICGERGNTESGCECTDFFDFLRYYDNE